MEQKTMSFFIVLVLVVLPILCYSQQVTELTFFVEAKKDICFCEVWEPQQVINITFYVKDGGKGDLNINFIALGPMGEKLHENIRTRANTIDLKPQTFGEHRLCFDNSHSQLHTKTVTFQYFLEESSETTKKNSSTEIQYATEEQNYQVSEADLKKAINKLQLKVGQIRYLQRQSKKQEDWDKYLVETKLDLVNTYSVVQMAVMLVAGFIQVLMVRSLFDEKSRIHRIWKKRPTYQ